MLSVLLRLIGVPVLFLMAAGFVQAATVYSYVGNVFSNITENDPPSGAYDTSMSVSGSFKVDVAFGEMAVTDISGLITAYSFFDGRNLLTNLNSEITQASVAVNSGGNITTWTLRFDVPWPEPVSVGDQTLSISTSNLFDTGAITNCVSIAAWGCSMSQQDNGNAIINSGAWSSATVPAPAAVWLFGSALGLLGWLRRRST